jgi:hypothetical protein
MSQSRPVFRPITPPEQVSDAELADFATSKGVPTMVNPPAQTPAAAPQIAQDAPSQGPRPPPGQKASRVKKPAPASNSTSDVKLSVRIPDYVSRELNIRAASERCTARHLVLHGLQAIGFAIKDSDLNPDERRIIYRKDSQ